jgi:hypothetical protein
MVGQNPPMPRAYPFFRFATTLATLLLFFTFGLNFLAPQLQAAPSLGIGGGQGEEPFAAQEAQPAIAEASVTEAPAAQEPPAELAPLPTLVPTLGPTLDSARNVETPTEKIDAAGNVGAQDQAQLANETPAPVPIGWQLILAGIALLGALLMLLMRQSAFQRWR